MLTPTVRRDTARPPPTARASVAVGEAASTSPGCSVGYFSRPSRSQSSCSSAPWPFGQPEVTEAAPDEDVMIPMISDDPV
jgi:hypothetical protein